MPGRHSQAVYLVDDEEPVVTAIGRLLRAAGFSARAFTCAREFLDCCGPESGGCVLLDMAMPGLDGLSLQKELKRHGIAMPVIFLTGRSDVPMAVAAMKEGAIDFLTKPPPKERLLSAVSAAMALDTKRRQEAAAQVQDRLRFEALTPREREVLAHVISGRPNKQIADDLGMVERTVKFHRAAVMRKLEVESLAELVRFAERTGIKPAQPTGVLE